MPKIRVGMIGCDLHGLYYGALMAKHDPLVLRDAHPRSQAAFFYHYLHYADPTVMTVPRLHEFEIVRCWDPDPEMAGVMRTVFGATICDSPRDCSDDVDLVFIPDCNGDGSNHLELATPGLEKGVPTFVDKPLAWSLADATAILDLGERGGGPVMSLSILRAVPQAAQFGARLPEVAPVGFGSIKGAGGTLAGQIHTISLAQAIFGAGVEAVECMGPTELAYLHLDYGGKADRPQRGVMLNCDSGPTNHCALYASAFGEKGAIHSGPIGDFEFPWGAAEILRRCKKMVLTGKAQAPREEMLECIAIAEAGRKAQETGRRVGLGEVG